MRVSGARSFDTVVAAVWRRLPAPVRRVVPRTFLGFACINLFTFGVDLAVLWALYRGIGLPNPVAVTGGYAAGFGLAFVLNRRFNFQVHGGVGGQLGRYLVVLAINYLAVILGIGSGLTLVGAPFWLARVAAGVVEAVWMYCAMRWWVFRTGRGVVPDGDAPAGWQDARPRPDRMSLTIDRRELDAVLFDMDGTLVDSSAAVTAAWTEFAQAHDLDPAAVLVEVHGVRASDSIARYLPAEQVDAAARVLLSRELELLDRVVAIPGAVDLLRALTEAGVPVAIVTSAPRDLALARLRAAGIPIPPVLVTAEDVLHGKPAPDCYLAGAARLDADPSRCLVFEDAEAGIRAGLVAGAQVVVIGAHRSETADALPRLVDYREVRVAA